MAGIIVIGSDFSAIVKKVRDAVTGVALTSATVTFQLYTAAGGAVAGGSGTASYVPGSAGTATDAEYAGVIESTTTSGLTAGAEYYVLYTITYSGKDTLVKENLIAQTPDGTIIDSNIWSAATGVSLAAGSAEETSAMAWCSAVRDAVIKAIEPFRAEPVSLANVILDAPNTRDLILPVRPARGIASVYLRSDANGLASRFEVGTSTTYLLDNSDGGKYQLVIDDHVRGISGCGILRRVGAVWGTGLYRAPGTLAPRMEPLRGAVLVNYDAGCSAVPEGVRAAAVYLVTKCMNARKHGTQVASAALNGASYSLASVGPGNIWKDPMVADWLAPYRPYRLA